MANQAEFKPFAVLSRARPCRIAFLIDLANCPPELIDALFETNYAIWGGRFNPIIPVSDGVIADQFWALLKYADPDVVYTYVKLSLDTIRRIEREIEPFRIEAHPEWMLEKPDPSFKANFRNKLVPSDRLIPILLSMRSWSFQKPKMLTFKGGWNWPFKRPLMRNFGLFEPTAFSRLPEGTNELQITESLTYSDVFDQIAKAGPIVFPFQLAESLAGFGDHEQNSEPEYSIIVGNDSESWTHFWNRIFLLPNPMGSRWNSLCLQKNLLADHAFVTALREFLKRFVFRHGQGPSELRFKSFEFTDSELRELCLPISNGIDVYPKFQILSPGEFPSLQTSKPVIFPVGVPGPVGQLRFGPTPQQAVTRSSLLQAPESPINLEQGTWVMDLQVEHVPKFRFYSNETLWWQLPRGRTAAQAFIPQTSSRIDRRYSISVEMQHYGPFGLQVPSDREMLHRVLGIGTGAQYTENLKLEFNSKFEWARASDKALYTNGIIELFGGLQDAGRMLHSMFWRTIFEQLSKRGGSSEPKLFESVRNSLSKKRNLLKDQLSGAHEKPIEWLTHLVINLARQQHDSDMEISFQELKERFHHQRKEYIAANPEFRTTTDIQEIQRDDEQATQDLMEILQWLADAGILRQGVTVRCNNCGSRFWRELGNLEPTWHCEGCAALVYAPVEPVWRYRLNTLVKNGIAFHGCVAVISALHTLRGRCKNAFVYNAGIAFYPKYGDAATAEVDFVCICDGELACGEVKTNASEFTVEELTKLANIAAELRVDQVVISAFHDEFHLMDSHAKKLKTLLPFNCEVQICRPRHAFQPSPHPAF